MHQWLRFQKKYPINKNVPMRAVLGMSTAMRSANGRGDAAFSAATPAHSGGGLNAADGGAPGLNARYSATYSSK